MSSVSAMSIDGDLTVDTDTLYVDSANNRVGIGTDSPGVTLHVGSGTPISSDSIYVSDGILFDGRIRANSAASNGTAAAPSICPGFDYDTGFFRPAFNTIGIATGGSEAMRIDSSGNVGIGTSSTAGVLDVRGSGSGTLLDNNTGKSFFDFNGTDNSPDRWNSTANSVLKLASSNNAMSFLVGGTTNNRQGGIQVGHEDGGFADILGSLRLNPLGGGVFTGGSLTVNGSISKNSGSFKIDHPIKPDTHHLVHSFVEGPQADNLYRGKVALVDGVATVNLDEAGRMTEGTFVALNGNVQCWTTNEDGWTQVRGKVEGNTLIIEAQDPACTDEVSWLVIGERHDQHMMDADWTDENGRVITEPTKGNTQ
jgi:hypothetical protein